MQKGFKIITFKLNHETHWRQGSVIYLEKKLGRIHDGRNLGQDMDRGYTVGGNACALFYIN